MGRVSVQPSGARHARITSPAALHTHVMRPNDTVIINLHRHEPPVVDARIDFLHYKPVNSPSPAAGVTSSSPAASAASTDVDVSSASTLLPHTIVVHKPAGIPVHASGRYVHNTIVGILQSDHGITAYRPTAR